MHISVIKTTRIKPGDDFFGLLDAILPQLPEKTILAIASKVVAVCQGRVVPKKGTDKTELIKQEVQYYLPAQTNPYGVTLSVVRGHLIASGGIDESNGGDNYVLWPQDLQKSVNDIREHLCRAQNLTHLGVILTDSTTRPFQLGTTGIGIAYSGFKPLKSYIGAHDIFGRKLQFQQNNIMNGLAAAAVMMMGEGNEQTPIAIIRDVPFIEFQSRNPTPQELALLHTDINTDLFAPLLAGAPWERGQG